MVAFRGFPKKIPKSLCFNTVHHDGKKAALAAFPNPFAAAMPLGDRAALDFRQDIIVVSVVVDHVDRVQRQRIIHHPGVFRLAGRDGPRCPHWTTDNSLRFRSDFSEFPAACD